MPYPSHYRTRRSVGGGNHRANNSMTMACRITPFSLVAVLLSVVINYINAFSVVSSPMKLLPRRKTLLELSDNNNNMPSQEEIAQQKQDAYNALSSFHETSSLAQSNSAQIKSLLKDIDTMDDDEQAKAEYWGCSGAATYIVPMDPAAGIKRGVTSKPYKCSVQIEMDLGGSRGGAKRSRGLRLVESIQFGKEGDGDDNKPFVRSIQLGPNVDVDAVDGSYSLDDTHVTTDESPSLPLLSPSLMAGLDPTAVQFLVEHSLAVSDTERCRCFLLYVDVSGSILEEDEYHEGRNYRLVGVILAEETKFMPEQQSTDEDVDYDYASEFISQVIESPSPSKSPSSPLDLLEINQTESEGDKMNRLMQSLEKHNKQVMDSVSGGDGYADSNTKMERHELDLFGLTSGVFLGDSFVRESLPAGQLSRILQQSRQKGFGNKGKEEEEDRFATWHVGVQKIALSFKWDYDKSVSQSYTYGKVMGTSNSLAWANIRSEGSVVLNEGRRTKKKEERRIIWDMDGGAYIAGLIGSSYFRAPRYISFTQSKGYSSSDAYLTEFLVFFESKREIDDDDGTTMPELYCSRSSRLYNANDGSLMQGSTAFFSREQPCLDSMEQEQ